MPATLLLTPGQFDLDQLRAIYQHQPDLQLADECREAILHSAQTVSQIIADQRTVYGINTGFGLLARTSIPEEQLATLQRNLILSHCTGTGALLDDASVALIMALKIGSLARGFSGVSPAVIETLLKLYRARVYPCIPSQGSVGASGDLAPLAHMSAILLGVGQVRHEGRILEAGEGLAIAGAEPLVLGPKEGLALINGTQVSTALALRGLFAAEKLFISAVVAGSLSVEALKGSFVPFDARIQAVRGQPGQITVAALYRELLHDSPINQSHIDCKRVQDPYSLRCQPQVMGACLDHLRFAAGVSCARPMRFPTTRWCSALTATFCQAVTSTPSRWPWPPMCWRWQSPRSARCPSGASPNWWTRPCPACRRSWSRKAGSTPAS